MGTFMQGLFRLPVSRKFSNTSYITKAWNIVVRILQHGPRCVIARIKLDYEFEVAEHHILTRTVNCLHLAIPVFFCTPT